MNPVVTTLWNADEGRLRAPWRLLLLAVAFAVGFPIAGELAVVVLLAVVPEATLVAHAPLVNDLLRLGLTLLFVGLLARFVDRRRFADLGVRVDARWWRDLAARLAVGALLATLVFVVELVAGWIVVVDVVNAGAAGLLVGFASVVVVNAGAAGLLVGFASVVVGFVAVGIYEELLVRGYLLGNLAEGLAGRLGRRGAVAVAATAALFGGAHLLNPNASLLGAVGVAVAGLTLAVAYVLTGELALPIGLHVTWNLFTGPIFGFPVSGRPSGASLLVTDPTGAAPTVLTGGAFGPEAGLVGIAVTLLGTGLVVAYVRWRDGRVAVPTTVTTPDLLASGPRGERDVGTDAIARLR